MTRSYEPDRPVAEANLDQLLEAGRRVPSAGFTQAVSLLVLTERADREDYWQLTRPESVDPAPDSPAPDDPAPDDPAADNAWLRGMSAAPVLLLVWTSEDAYRQRYAEPDKGWTPEGRWSAPYWWVDAGMVVQNLLLAATDLGLGAAFVGVPADRQEVVAQRYGVPAEQSSVGLITIGHPRRAPRRPRRARRPATELVHRGRWDSP